MQDRVLQNHGTQRFQVYLRRDNLLLRLHAIGLQLDSREDPYSPILVQLLETFCSCASPWRDLQLLHLRSWTSSSWEPSQCHELGSGAMRGANRWHKYLGSLDLNLTTARSQKDKTLEATGQGLYGLRWQFCEYLEDQKIIYLSG